MTIESNASKITKLESELKTRYELRLELKLKCEQIEKLFKLLSEAESHDDIGRQGEVVNDIGVALAELRGITVQINALFACKWQRPGYVPQEDDSELYGATLHPDFSKLVKLQKLRKSNTYK